MTFLAVVFTAIAVMAETLMNSPATGTNPLQTASRLVAQAKPYASLTVEAPSHEVAVALPYSSLAGLERDTNAAPTRRVQAVIVYDVPALRAQSDWVRMVQIIHGHYRAQKILLAPVSLTFQHLGPGKTQVGQTWLHRDGKETVPGVGAVSVHVLPRTDNGAQSLAMLQIDAPHVSVGVIYRVPAQSNGAWPREHEVIVLQLSKLYPVVDLRSLTILDPEVAIVLNDQEMRPSDPALTSMIEHLRDLWVDVYQVSSNRPFVILAGSHGLLLPMHSTVSGKSVSLGKNLAGNRP